MAAHGDPIDGFDEMMRVLQADADAALVKILRFEEQQRWRALPWWRRWLTRRPRGSR